MSSEQEKATVTLAVQGSRQVWERPELIEVKIDAVTRSPYSLGGNDGTPHLTSIS